MRWNVCWGIGIVATDEFTVSYEFAGSLDTPFWAKGIWLYLYASHHRGVSIEDALSDLYDDIDPVVESLIRFGLCYRVNGTLSLNPLPTQCTDTTSEDITDYIGDAQNKLITAIIDARHDHSADITIMRSQETKQWVGKQLGFIKNQLLRRVETRSGIDMAVNKWLSEIDEYYRDPWWRERALDTQRLIRFSTDRSTKSKNGNHRGRVTVQRIHLHKLSPERLRELDNQGVLLDGGMLILGRAREEIVGKLRDEGVLYGPVYYRNAD